MHGEKRLFCREKRGKRENSQFAVFCSQNRGKRGKSAICSILQSKPRENGLFCGKMQLVRRKSAGC